MDADLFDRFSRLIGQVAPRRALLALVGGLSSTLATEELAWSKKKRKKKGKKKRKKKPNPAACQNNIATNGGLTFSAEAKYRKKTLRLRYTEPPFGDTGNTSSRTEITLSGAPLLTTEVSTTGGVLSVTVTYGSAIGGINRASIVNDGTTITGDIDGRAIAPLPAGADPASLRFADGGPAPTLQLEPGLEQAIGAVLAAGRDRASTCAEARGQSRNGKGDRSRGRGVSSEDVNPLVQPRCLLALTSCRVAASICGGVLAASCAATLFGYAICLGGGLLGCLTAYETCRRVARHGGVCCPVSCGGDPVGYLWGEDPSCCSAGESCLDPNNNRKGCCAEGFRACQGKSCCADDQECEADGICCRPGYSSCGGQCCPDGSCLDGSCCAPPSGVACGGTCCPPFTRSCCGTACCDGDCINNSICCRAPNEVCINRCCPPGKCCNGVCCGNNESCQNNVCRPVCSPTIHETCPNLPGYPQCCPKGTNCCASGECCPNFAPVCCGDGCCTVNQECCPDNVCRTTCIR